MDNDGSMWWDRRWANRGAVALAPIGALVCIVLAAVAFREVSPALLAYVVGAVVFGVAGHLGGGLAGAVHHRVRRRARRRALVSRVPVRRGRVGWVMHTH